ncbi:MAG TPA: RNB domain-containing ribonuclease [Verrucomicrobiae bacterium]|jgi:exoribonuclease-2|nr:RNB domain-containing ribonuclease [Verrucomicrobiae bacterium]
MTHAEFLARARQALSDAGFHPDFSPEIMRETTASPKLAADSRDLRKLLWSSIDNENSRDLDQVEYVEMISPGCTRLLVGVADVDAIVPLGSATDQHAAAETTSVYAGTVIFPMLPDALSTDRTSLLPDQDRAAIVIEMHIRDTGEVACHDVYPATLRNHAKLAYRSTGAWLEGRGPMPAPIANVPGMEAQLRLQLETSKKLRQLRREQGALVFNSTEATPIIENGELKTLAFAEQNAAQDIIESFMVAANVSMAQHLKEHNSVSIRRVVKTPKRWDRIQVLAKQYGTKLPNTPDPRALSEFLEQRKAADLLHFPDLSLAIVKMLGPGEYVVEPVGREHEGHFGLAVRDYAHSTAPNRRYVDLVTQRLLKAVIADAPAPYLEQQLADVAKHCTEREDAAKKVERLMSKVIAANLLSHQVGQTFDGLVTGASDKGTYVRLLKFPAEGKVIRGAQGLDVGDKTTVRLVGVDVNRGFIDFERK